MNIYELFLKPSEREARRFSHELHDAFQGSVIGLDASTNETRNVVPDNGLVHPSYRKSKYKMDLYTNPQNNETTAFSSRSNALEAQITYTISSETQSTNHQ